jgi:hypothetical protein
MQPCARLIGIAALVLLAACDRSPTPPATGQVAPVAPAPAAPPAPASPADGEAQWRAHRAAEAVIWGMPAVNYDLMRQQMLGKTPGKENQVIYWGRPLDWHNQTLTPNPDTIYLMAFLNTREVGPVVLEIPPAGPAGSINANIVNTWQVPLEDAGAHGIDAGKGIRFVLVPPGYNDPVPAGFQVLEPGTFGSYALIRSTLASHADADVARSVDYGKQVRVYPLSQAAHPPATTFVDVADVDFDSTIRYDASYFDNLDRIVQQEPWLPRDSVMIDKLKSLGIEKGKAFAPDAAIRSALEAGIQAARQRLAATYDRGFPIFYPGTHWMLPADPALIASAQGGFTDPDAYPVDARGLAYTYAYIGIKRMGAGQFYMIATKDSAGAALDGNRTYQLHVPPNVPVEQYWSVTAYDRQTHALIRNMPRASRASNIADLVRNPDGSVDLFFGPAAPQGKQANWIPTDPVRGFEVMFRAYGPTPAFMQKAWALPDLVAGGAEAR